MPVPTFVQLDVRFLVEVDGQLLLRLAAGGQGPLELPGGPVADGETVSAAVARLLSATLGGPVEDTDGSADSANLYAANLYAADDEKNGPAFVACVEHGDPSRAREHALTVLYAVAPRARPAAAVGDTLVDPPTLTRTAGVPPPVAVAAVRWAEDGWPSWHGLAVSGAEPWWNGLRRSVGSVRAQLTARRAHLADVEFRDAAVAMCAMVAAADGRIDKRERAAMLDAMAADEVLAQFGTTDVERLFDEHVARLRADPGAGRRAAHHDIARLRGRPGQARSVIALGGVIGRADGVFDALERAAVRAAAESLDVSAADFAVQSVTNTEQSATDRTNGGGTSGRGTGEETT